MKLFSKQFDRPFITLFVVCGALAGILGGVLSAFTASAPTTFTAWASAYLVLVVGVVQIGFGLVCHQLVHRSRRAVAWLAFTLYNLGNIAVIYSVLMKETGGNSERLVDIGGALLLVAVLGLCYGVYGAKWSWTLGVFYIAAIVIIISTPIGLFLGH